MSECARTAASWYAMFEYGDLYSDEKSFNDMVDRAVAQATDCIAKQIWLEASYKMDDESDGETFDCAVNVLLNTTYRNYHGIHPAKWLQSVVYDYIQTHNNEE